MQTYLISNGMTPAHAATRQSIKTTKAKRSGVRIMLVAVEETGIFFHMNWRVAWPLFRQRVAFCPQKLVTLA
jgi:hypothetical protein